MDVSEGSIASVIKVKGLNELGINVAVTYKPSTPRRNSKRATCRHVPEDGTLDAHDFVWECTGK
jgi:hypothetical protein